MFQFRLRELLAEKERQVGHRIPLRAVSEATGVSVQVLSSLNSPGRKIVTNTAYLEALCRYFRCMPNDLLILSPDHDSEESCHVDHLYPDRTRRRADR
jgi:DNA-binding Xre family transcriptional regulator